MGRNKAVRRAVAAFLYGAGAALVIYVYYEDQVAPITTAGYVYLWGLGVILVALAASLWPEAGREGHENAGDDEEDTA